MIETDRIIRLSQSEAGENGGATYRRESARAAQIGKRLQVDPPDDMDVAPVDGVDVELSVEEAAHHQTYLRAQKTARARGGEVRVKGQPQF